MWETVVVVLLVAGAAAYMGYRLWRGATEDGCSCDGACSECAPRRDADVGRN